MNPSFVSLVPLFLQGFNIILQLCMIALILYIVKAKQIDQQLYVMQIITKVLLVLFYVMIGGILFVYGVTFYQLLVFGSAWFVLLLSLLSLVPQIIIFTCYYFLLQRLNQLIFGMRNEQIFDLNHVKIIKEIIKFYACILIIQTGVSLIMSFVTLLPQASNLWNIGWNININLNIDLSSLVFQLLFLAILEVFALLYEKACTIYLEHQLTI